MQDLLIKENNRKLLIELNIFNKETPCEKGVIKMNYNKYIPIDVVNGEGTRCTLFVSGCEHQCDGCYNKKTWSFNSGFLFDKEMEDQIINDLNDKRIKRKGLSLSGGDPLNPKNIESILKLLKRVKEETVNKDIWLWTGYKKEELNENQKEVLNYIDVLIDGKFIKELKNPSLKWMGSSNQILYRFS